jgi:hypothetical protein
MITPFVISDLPAMAGCCPALFVRPRFDGAASFQRFCGMTRQSPWRLIHGRGEAGRIDTYFQPVKWGARCRSIPVVPVSRSGLPREAPAGTVFPVGPAGHLVVAAQQLADFLRFRQRAVGHEIGPMRCPSRSSGLADPSALRDAGGNSSACSISSPLTSMPPVLIHCQYGQLRRLRS